MGMDKIDKLLSTEEIVNQLMALTPSERLIVFNKFCMYCGDTAPCYCVDIRRK